MSITSINLPPGWAPQTLHTSCFLGENHILCLSGLFADFQQVQAGFRAEAVQAQPRVGSGGSQLQD